MTAQGRYYGFENLRGPIMPHHLFACLVLGLLMTAGLAAPSLAAGKQQPPVDWSGFIDSLGETPKDFVVGEDMC